MTQPMPCRPDGEPIPCRACKRALAKTGDRR